MTDDAARFKDDFFSSKICDHVVVILMDSITRFSTIFVSKNSTWDPNEQAKMAYRNFCDKRPRSHWLCGHDNDYAWLRLSLTYKEQSAKIKYLVFFTYPIATFWKYEKGGLPKAKIACPRSRWLLGDTRISVFCDLLRSRNRFSLFMGGPCRKSILSINKNLVSEVSCYYPFTCTRKWCKVKSIVHLEIARDVVGCNLLIFVISSI